MFSTSNYSKQEGLTMGDDVRATEQTPESQEPYLIERAVRPESVNEPRRTHAAVWRSEVPGLVIQWQNGAWVVTHEPSGYLIPMGGFGGGASCCRKHAEEWVSELAEAGVDWTEVTRQAIEQDDDLRQRLVGIVRELDDAWRCDHYQPVVTLDEAIAIVALDSDYDRDTVADVLREATDLYVVRLVTTGGPEW